MLPSLESEFLDKDLVSEQFQDMEEAICFLGKALKDIAEGRPNAPQHAKETILALPSIWVPLVKLRLG